MIVKRKAFAYITRGHQLLVFTQPKYPNAGIQVPAGSIHEGEDPAEAVMREAHEETGLEMLEMLGFLGEVKRDMRDVGREEIAHRFFYHLRAPADTPDRWRWAETDPSEGDDFHVEFDFFWADLPDGVPRLITDNDALVPLLNQRLGLK